MRWQPGHGYRWSGDRWKPGPGNTRNVRPTEHTPEPTFVSAVGYEWPVTND